MTTIHVLLFSVLRQRIGKRQVTITADAGITGRELLDLLVLEYPEVAAYRPVVRLAVNEEYAPEGVVLADGDEVALITPVSGG